MKALKYPHTALMSLLLLFLFVGTACNQPVDIRRFQLINQTPYEITYFGIATSEAALATATNQLSTPLPSHAVAEVDVATRGRYWLKAIANAKGAPEEHIHGPITMSKGIVGWTWNMDGLAVATGTDPDTLYAQSYLPVLVIDTQGKAIPDEPKIPATLHISNNESGLTNRPTLTGADFSSAIAIERRGNSTQTFPKASWTFELRDGAGNDIDAPLLGLPEEEDWVLYGPWMDRSLIRNVFGYGLWEGMGWYAPRTHFCEVYLYDDPNVSLEESYYGVYVLTEKIKRDVLRLDIAELTPEVIVEPEISGGYLLEMKLPERLDPGELALPLADGFVATLVAPDEDNITPAQTAWIQDHLTAFESALFGEDFQDPVAGYAPFIDVDSFIDYMLLQELLKNRDAFHSSTYFYKDREGPIHMGPIWDLNIALGYFSFNGYQKPEGWILYWGGSSVERSRWTMRLLQDPAFVQRYQDRWFELRGGLLATDALDANIDAIVAELNTAQARQFIRWPSLGHTLFPDIRYLMYIGPHPANYQGEIDYLRDWLHKRAAWIDANIEEL